MTSNTLRWAVFVSGEGSNLQNVLDLEAAGALKNQVVIAVHADRECPGIARARNYKKAIFVESPKQAQFEDHLLEFLAENRIDRLLLLGYMRILKGSFLRRWAKPVINLHPSLLPRYPGLNAIDQALQAGDREIGVTLHEVVEQVDAGPILKQYRLEVVPGVSRDDIVMQVHQRERELVRDFLVELDSAIPH